MNKIEVSHILEKLSPLSLAEFEFNGFLTKNNQKKDIRILAFTLGFSQAAIKLAIKQKVDMLVIHNAPEALLIKNDYYKKINKILTKAPLCVYRMHLPLDFAEKGIIFQLCQLMQFDAKPVSLLYEGHKITGGVYVAEEKLSLREVIRRVKLLAPNTMRIVKGKRKIKKIAITSGDGCKPEFLLQINPDVFICGLLNQESIRVANDLGITLIEATSYATESEPLRKFVDSQKSFFKGIEVNFIDIKNDVVAV